MKKIENFIIYNILLKYCKNIQMDYLNNRQIIIPCTHTIFNLFVFKWAADITDDLRCKLRQKNKGCNIIKQAPAYKKILAKTYFAASFISINSVYLWYRYFEEKNNNKIK